MDDAEKARMTARLNELGMETVREHLKFDGFPYTWRLGIIDWLREQEQQKKAAEKPKPGA